MAMLNNQRNMTKHDWKSCLDVHPEREDQCRYTQSIYVHIYICIYIYVYINMYIFMYINA